MYNFTFSDNFELLGVTLRCFVAKHARLSSVKFLGLKLRLCKKRDKYEVCGDKTRQNRFQDKTAYVWVLDYRWRSFAIDDRRSRGRATYASLGVHDPFIHDVMHVSMMHVSMIHASMMHVSMMHVSMMIVSIMRFLDENIPDTCFQDAYINVSMMHVSMMHVSWCIYVWCIYLWSLILMHVCMMQVWMMHVSMIFDPEACIYDAANLFRTDGRTRRF